MEPVRTIGGSRCADGIHRRQKTDAVSTGFTLLELLIAMAIASVLLAVAIPSFASLSRDNQMRSTVDGLLLDFTYARSEAIKRIAPVVLCKSSNGSTCSTTGNWADGWLVFVDSNRNSKLDSSTAPVELVLASRSLKKSELLVTTEKFPDFITFLADGTVNTSGRFEFKDGRGSESMRAICVATLGGVRTDRTASC